MVSAWFVSNALFSIADKEGANLVSTGYLQLHIKF